MSGDLTEQLLKYVDSHNKVDTLDLVPIFGIDHQKIVGALKSIQATDENLLTVEQTSRKTWKLTDEGQQFVEEGSHEARIFNAVPSDGISFDVLQKVSKFIKFLNISFLEFFFISVEFKIIYLFFSYSHLLVQKLAVAKQWPMVGYSSIIHKEN